ncbi:unnamed protein product, partial [Schistosoma mattheei]
MEEEETTMEDNWKGIKEASTSTCQVKKSIRADKKKYVKELATTAEKAAREGNMKKKNKKIAINNSRTRTEKVQAQAEYIEANKEVKKRIRADKKKYVKELAMTAEKAAREGNMK